MSAHAFALTSPSLTDMSDDLNRREAINNFYAAEQRGDAALAAWARMYAPPLIAFADEAPTDETVAEATQEAIADARSELHGVVAQDLDELLGVITPALQELATAHKALEALAAKSEAAA